MDNVQEEEEEVQQEGEARDWEYKSNRQTEGRSCPLLLPSKRQELIENRCNDDDDDDYHQASTRSAVFNLSTTIVGAGIMALPATIKVLGLPLGLVAILLAGILSENSIQALLRYSRPCNATSYGALMANAFGEAGRIVLQLCIIINNFGSLIVYIIIIGDVMSGTVGPGQHHTGVLEEWAGGRTWWNERVFVLFTTTVIILLPLCSLKHIDSLKWTSALSFVLALVFVVITVGITSWKLAARQIEWPRLTPNVHDQASFWHLFTVVPILVTAYFCHHNVHPIANELELSTEPSDMKMRKVVRECLILCTSIYFCTGLFAYLLFGEATSDDVLANFDANLGIPFSHTLTLLVRASYAVHIMLVFPLLHFSLRLNVDGLLFPKAAALVHDNLRFALITGFLVFLIFFGSTLVPNIWVAFEYTGATVGVCLAFIFPGLIMLKDKPGMATVRDKWEAWVMVILAMLSSVTVIATNLLTS
ncbi:hypothetical protein BDL97_02G029000 [Sphagnum fallax]|nr:hypothetical protein BDL97_02G029000 [Sphagnum fallax]